MKKQQAAELLAKYNDGSATLPERRLVESWFVSESQHQELDPENLDYLEIKNRVWSQIPHTKQHSKPLRRLSMRMVTAVAAALACLIFGVWLYKGYNGDGNRVRLTNNGSDQRIVPGGNKATIVLADGRVIELNKEKRGLEIGQGRARYADGERIADAASSSIAKEQLLTAITPKGGTYEFILSDGSKVLLNAGTVLKFPSSFPADGKRIVQLVKGEAYFEVAKDKAHPFIVQGRDQRVEVLGTHFNISSYAEDANVKTTLLEGSVRVNDVLLKPNEQSVLENNEITVTAVDAEKIVAWKNGKFVFTSESIESIMVKLSRWYNVEVVYQGDVRNEIFTGSMSRYDDISKILETITFTQAVHFKIEGRRITVMP